MLADNTGNTSNIDNISNPVNNLQNTAFHVEYWWMKQVPGHTQFYRTYFSKYDSIKSATLPNNAIIPIKQGYRLFKVTFFSSLDYDAITAYERIPLSIYPRKGHRKTYIPYSCTRF